MSVSVVPVGAVVDAEDAPERAGAPSESVERDTQFSGVGATPHCEKEKGDLGPVVINADGSLSRIKNWLEMTDAEREQTRRVVLARNARRRAKLEQEQQDAEEAKDTSAAPSA